MVLGKRVTSQSCLYEWMIDLYKETKTCVGNKRVIGVSREGGSNEWECTPKGGGGNARGRKEVRGGRESRGVARRGREGKTVRGVVRLRE